MNRYKTECLNKLCYTDLVYERINKKLNIKFSKYEIEKLIDEIIRETNESQFQKTGKNIYVTNEQRNIRITINSFTYRIITVDKLVLIKEKVRKGVDKLTKTFTDDLIVE